MKPHVVRQGEYLLQIAHSHGLSAEQIWSHPRNAALVAARPDPNQLCPGDILTLPDPPPPGIAFRPHAHNAFRAAPPQVRVHFCFRVGGEALASEPYEVHGAGAVLRASTDADGFLDFAVPVGVPGVDVHFPRRRLRVPVRVGGLDPIATRSGVRQRLANLGAPRRPDVGEHDDAALAHAIAWFQRRHQLPVTGAMDGATTAALEAEHDRAGRAPGRTGE